MTTNIGILSPKVFLKHTITQTPDKKTAFAFMFVRFWNHPRNLNQGKPFSPLKQISMTDQQINQKEGFKSDLEFLKGSH